MAEFFDPGTASGMIKTLIDINSQWSEGVPPDVMASYAKEGIQVFNNGKTVTINYSTPDGFIKQFNASAENFPNTSAAQALEAYKSAGGKVSNNGASAVASNKISSGGKVTTFEVAGTAGAGATKLSVGGILSMNLPTAAAAIAPIAGAALGVGLYESNPDLWGKISRALLPFCYDDTELLPVVYDENGNTFISEAAIDAVSEVLKKFSSNTIVTDRTAFPIVSENMSPFPFSVNYSSAHTYENGYGVTTVETSAPVIAIFYGYTKSMLLRAAPYPFTFYDKPAWSYTHDGKTVYGYDSSVAPTPIWGSGSVTYLNGSVGAGELAWTAVYGSEKILATGVAEWDGVQYPQNPDAIDVVTSVSDNGEPLTKDRYLPVAIPTGKPGVSVDPTVADLTTNPDPSSAINPWIVPSPSPSTYPPGVSQSNPSPIPDGVPNYDPILDPNDNSSQLPQQKPQEQPSPQDPTSDGTTTAPQIPPSPGISGATGLIHVYNPTMGAVEKFGTWLWTTFSGNIIDTVSKLFNNPMDAVIGLHELYVKPNIAGSNTIRAGYLDSGIASEVVGNRYSSLNCGSVVVPEWYQNYLDYSPYTKCFAYLPFIGIVPLAADDIIGSAVNITYHIDSYTGCCIAIITTAREGYSATTYQFEGNCAVEVPITSGYQSTLMSAMLGIAGTAVTGSPHVGLAAASLGRATLGKNEVSHSGSFGASYGAMGLKTPYIIVKRPTQKIAPNYNVLYGLPAHKIVTIGACTGYLRVREVHVQSPTATNDEKARIEELLKEGVFVT